jgi:ribosomal protein S12 methylthiotransferase accessory factor
VAKAIGEAVERYCSAIFNVDDLPLSSSESAGFHCVSPGQFALFSPGQYDLPNFPFVPFEKATPVRWVPALDAMTGERRCVPAAMVYVPYTVDRRAGECQIAQPISTGLACHCSPAEAAINAVCEVIERDAFTITWQARLARPHIRIETLDNPNADRVRRFERAGYSVTLLDITMDVAVPTVLAISRGSAPDAVPIVFAAAAALNPSQAIRKSLEELEHTRAYCQVILCEWPRLTRDPDYCNVLDQESHLNFWCDQDNTHLADFIFESNISVNFNDIPNAATGDPGRDLSVLGRKVRAIGHRMLLCDLTTPDVRELGLAVVRAIVPGFHPLVVGHRVRALGGHRLWEIPQKLGYRGINRESGDNPLPHPYP